MELIFQIIVMLAVVKFCLEAGFFQHWFGAVSFALFVAILSMLFYPRIINTNSNAFEELLSSKTHISNIAVLITLEAISGMLISMGMLGNLFSHKKQRGVKVLKLIPGILIIGAVFYIELELFRNLGGMEFIWITCICAALFFGVTMALSFAIKWLLPEQSARYELKFLTNLVLLFLSIILNAGLADYNASNYQANPEFTKLAVFAAIAVVGFVLGIFYYKYRYIFRKKLLKV